MSGRTPPDMSAHQHIFKADPSVPTPINDVSPEDTENGSAPVKGRGVNRVGRACNGCRKQKMRCEGADEPPCKRCRHARIQCVFEKPSKDTQGPGEAGLERIRNLESQVSSLTNTLTELVSSLRGSSAPSGSAHPQASPHIPPYYQGSSQSPVRSSSSQTGLETPSSLTNPLTHLSYPPQPQLDPQPADALAMSQSGLRVFPPISISTVHHPPMLRSSSASTVSPHLQAHATPLATPSGRFLFNPIPGPSDVPAMSPEPPVIPPYQPIILPPITYRNSGSPPPTGQKPLTLNERSGAIRSPDVAAQRPFSALRRPSGGGPTSPTRTRTHATVTFSADSVGHDRHSAHQRGSVNGNSLHPASSSNVPSRAPSVYGSDDEAELPTSGLLAPLEVLRTISEVHQDEEENAVGMLTRSISPDPDTEGYQRPAKKRKVVTRPPPPNKRPHAFPDVITKNIITIAQARLLFLIFYTGCSKFLPVFEPLKDTLVALHERSPFCVSAICMVGSKVKDGNGKPSAMTLKLKEEVQHICSASLFTSVARREAIQAMILIAGWSTWGWLLGGHAVRMGLELGLQKAWPRLANRMRNRKNRDVLDDHDLVVCTRIWFVLYVFEHQISFGTGRPGVLKEDESVIDCRLFLQHPLCIEDDLRLVSTVELMSIRARLHRKLMPFDVAVTPETFKTLAEGKENFTTWFERWDQEFAIRYDNSTFYRHSLLIQRYVSELFHNAVCLRGINNRDDVVHMSEEQRQVAVESVRVGKAAMDICIRSFNYRDSLQYAPDYTHVTATFAAAFLLRLSRLFPEEADFEQVCSDVRDLADILGSVPATRYGNTLSLMLQAAQAKRRVLPSSELAVDLDDADHVEASIMSGIEVDAGPQPMLEDHDAKSTSYSPGNAVIPMGVPLIYPQAGYLDPALGGLNYDVLQSNDPDLWAAAHHTSYPVVPPGFGYEAFLMPGQPDFNTAIW